MHQIRSLSANPTVEPTHGGKLLLAAHVERQAAIMSGPARTFLPLVAVAVVLVVFSLGTSFRRAVETATRAWERGLPVLAGGCLCIAIVGSGRRACTIPPPFNRRSPAFGGRRGRPPAADNAPAVAAGFLVPLRHQVPLTCVFRTWKNVRETNANTG
jgi:hypothetical protein